MADQGSIANLKQNIDENIVQNTTKQISGTKMNTVLNNIVDTLNFIGRDFFNVNEYNEQATAYSDAATARADVPDEVKKNGLVITYLLADGWHIDQFIGSNISGWETASNWNVFGPISVSQNTLSIGGVVTNIRKQVISLSYIGVTKVAGLPDMSVGQFGVDTNNPAEYFQKTADNAFVTYPMSDEMLFIYKNVLLIYNGTRLALSPIYAQNVVNVIAFSSSRPQGIADGQFYVNTQSKTLVLYHSDNTFSTPLTTSGIYRYEGVLYWYNGTVITELSAKPKDVIVIQYINYTTPPSIQDGEYYLNSSTGNVVAHYNGSNVIITPHDGMIVFYKGVFLMYSATDEIWLPQVSDSWKVPIAKGTNVRWRNNGSGKLYPFISSSGTTDWRASIPQKVHKGDVIICNGSGSDNNPLLLFTDNEYNILKTLVYTAGTKVPYVCISEYDGYLYMNADASITPYLYLSSCERTVDIVGIFNANPLFWYDTPLLYGQIYYKNDTERFLFNTDQGTVANITELFNAVIGQFDVAINGEHYQYTQYGIGVQKVSKFPLRVKEEEPLSPEVVSTLKSGITFDNPTFMDEMYSKFDGLITSYPNYVSKNDAVTLANSFGNNLAYPVYCRLGGVAQGDYLATPTYYINVYKISTGDSEAINHSSWNKKTKIFLVGGNHPYELAAPVNLYLFIKNILENLTVNANYWNILSNADIYVLPCLNGYGIYHAQDGYMRTNANGVNINRNFPTVRWSQGEPGQDYGGDAPGSEFETQLIMALTKGLMPQICIDAHNFDKAETQFYTIWGVNKYECEQIGCNFFVDMSYRLKKAYPTYFGSSFGYITASGVTLGKGGAMTDWWNLNAHISLPFTFEISRCINYQNGIYNSTDYIDDYGNTLFSVNEIAIRTFIMMLLHNLI